jgi:hypothetical protein
MYPRGAFSCFGCCVFPCQGRPEKQEGGALLQKNVEDIRRERRRNVSLLIFRA